MEQFSYNYGVTADGLVAMQCRPLEKLMLDFAENNALCSQVAPPSFFSIRLERLRINEV